MDRKTVFRLSAEGSAESSPAEAKHTGHFRSQRRVTSTTKAQPNPSWGGQLPQSRGQFSGRAKGGEGSTPPDHSSRDGGPLQTRVLKLPWSGQVFSIHRQSPSGS